MENFSDVQLVEKTLQNPDNYAWIIERFEEPILRYIGRMTGAPHEEIEELGQIIFIKAYRSLNSFDTRLKFSSWLYRIAHNVCIDYLRKSSKKHVLSLDAEDEMSRALIEKIATSENISLHVSQEAQKQWIRQIIALLPEKYRIVLLLFFMEDKSYEEISDILQIPVSTVWTLLSRAKKHFLALTGEPQFSHLFTYA